MKCQVPRCDGRVVSKGLCDKHRQRLQKHGHLDPTRPFDWGVRGKHPLINVHRQATTKSKFGVVPEWKDFWAFVEAVGPRPENHIFRRYDDSKPFGPDNYYWHPIIARWDDKSEYSKEYRKRRPLSAKNSQLKCNFGIDLDDYYDMLEKQGGVCAICGTDKNGKYAYFCVDHCHETKNVRGLLCGNCNRALGFFKDRIDLLDAAKQYLTL